MTSSFSSGGFFNHNNTLLSMVESVMTSSFSSGGGW